MKRLFYTILTVIVSAQVSFCGDDFSPEKIKRKDWVLSQGITASALSIKGVPCEIRIVKFDLKNKNLRFDIWQGNNSLFSTAEVGTMAAALQKKFRVRPIAGINADFFNNNSESSEYGNPIGLSLCAGKLFTTGIASEDYVLYQTPDKLFKMERLTFSGEIVPSTKKDSASVPIRRVNANANGMKNGVILFTPDWKDGLPANGVKLKFDKIDNSGIPAKWIATVDKPIKKGTKLSGKFGAVVGMGSYEEAVEALSGKVVINLKFLGTDVPIKNAIRVWETPMLDGKIRDTHEVMNYPRTMFGFSKDIFVFFVSDGRNPKWSQSLPSAEAAKILEAEGCTQVGQFDGGGSASIWVGGVYMNKPSDGSARKVSNGIFFSFDKSGMKLNNVKKLPDGMKNK